MTERVPENVATVLRAARRLPEVMPGVVAVGLAGSWARGSGRPDSDVDLVVLTTAPAELLDSADWFAMFDAAAVLIRSGDFGAVQERRLLLADGTVVEVGIGRPDWTATRPVDPGTHRVVSDGFVVLHDPAGILEDLLTAVRG